MHVTAQMSPTTRLAKAVLSDRHDGSNMHTGPAAPDIGVCIATAGKSCL
jgi:hypothetical protein